MFLFLKAIWLFCLTNAREVLESLSLFEKETVFSAPRATCTQAEEKDTTDMAFCLLVLKAGILSLGNLIKTREVLLYFL